MLLLDPHLKEVFLTSLEGDSFSMETSYYLNLLLAIIVAFKDNVWSKLIYYKAS